MNTMRNCPRCGKLFAPIRSAICNACEREDEEVFQKVKEYVEENPMSTLSEVVNETGVSAKRIQRFLREGRLEVTKGLEGNLKCESCGLPISTGKFCSSCSNSLAQQIDNSVGTNTFSPLKNSSTKARMHLRRRQGE